MYVLLVRFLLKIIFYESSLDRNIDNYWKYIIKIWTNNPISSFYYDDFFIRYFRLFASFIIYF